MDKEDFRILEEEKQERTKNQESQLVKRSQYIGKPPGMGENFCKAINQP